MNILLLKKISGVILLGLCFASSAVAQPAASGNPPTKLVPPIKQPITIPWDYPSPSKLSNATATVDEGGAIFLPWIGNNVIGLMNYADFFYQLEKDNVNGEKTGAYDTAGTMQANNELSQTQKDNLKAVNSKTTKQYQQLMTYTPKADDPESKSNQATKNAEIKGTDISVPCESNAGCTNIPFNASTLFDVTGYGDNVDTGAGTPPPTTNDIKTLIYFLANLSIQFPDPGFAKNSDATARAAFMAKNKNQLQQYILATRTLGALQSMALSNFNLLAQERLIIKDKGTEAGIKIFPPIPKDSKDNKPPKPIDVKDASQLQVDKYLIDKRLNNPEWYLKMNTATPIALQRETLFVLAEMQRQIYELRMVNERMLATLSTMQMSMIQLSLPQLTVQAESINNPPQQPPSPPNPQGQ